MANVEANNPLLSIIVANEKSALENIWFLVKFVCKFKIYRRKELSRIHTRSP